MVVYDEPIDYNQIDPVIRRLVKRINNVPNITTRYCCAGIGLTHEGKSTNIVIEIQLM